MAACASILRRSGQEGGKWEIAFVISFYYFFLKAFYPGNTRKLFHVSLFQAVSLLQFNDSDLLTFNEILQRTGIEKQELLRTLKSLSLGKVRVLARERPGGAGVAGEGKRDREKEKDKGDGEGEEVAGSVLETDSFRWRSDFKHKMMRIKINTIQVKSDAMKEITSIYIFSLFKRFKKQLRRTKVFERQ